MKYRTKTFSKEFMESVLWEDAAKIISNEICDNNRWSIFHELTFEYEGQVYQTTYSKGATESQDEGPWEYEKTVDCYLVEPVEKLVTVYEMIPEVAEVG